uniref:mTERF domain-containing protein 1, mitochondrial n=1 Tax=Aegilops tauschii TaxID=37682 RepID=M8C606_AEGTA
MLRLQKRRLSLLRYGGASPLPTFPVTSLHRHLSATATATATATTSTESPFSVQDYLVNTCGLTRAQSLKASRSISHLRSPSNPDAVRAFLSGLGLSSSDIAVVVAADPKFLCSRVDETLAPRVAKLRNLGLSPSKIARLVLIGAPALRSCDFWIPLFGSFDELVKAVSRGALGGGALLRCDIDTVVKPNVELLLRCGFNIPDLAKTGFNGTRVIVCSPEKLQALVARADELGVPRGSGLFIYALATVFWVTQEKLVARMELLKKTLGCSDDMLKIVVVKHPSLLRSSEDNLRSTVEFLINKALYIAPRPVLIMYSLEKRFKLLSQNGLLDVELDYYTTALLAKKKFLHKLVDSYKDIVPGLADDYASACLGKPPKGDDRP